MEALKVVAVQRDGDGNISNFKLNDERIISFNECRDLINSGKLDLVCAKGRSGSLIIRSKPDSDQKLSELPTF